MLMIYLHEAYFTVTVFINSSYKDCLRLRLTVQWTVVSSYISYIVVSS